MTRGKILFMLAGAIVVVILLWVAQVLQQSAPGDSGRKSATPDAATNNMVGDFYVAGHVTHPQMYPLRPGETARAAINGAGGTDTEASHLVLRLTRKTNGQPETQSIPLPQVLSGENDPQIQLGDLINVVQEATPATLPNIQPSLAPATNAPQ